MQQENKIRDLIRRCEVAEKTLAEMKGKNDACDARLEMYREKDKINKAALDRAEVDIARATVEIKDMKLELALYKNLLSDIFRSK
jgi:chromosome segregation ATPase